MRTVSFDIPPQEILTKDSVTIAVDAVVYYKISNANGNDLKRPLNLTELENFSQRSKRRRRLSLDAHAGPDNLAQYSGHADTVGHSVRA